MAPDRLEDGFVRMPEHEFEAILPRAAEEGAKRALVDAGLVGDEAALDIRDLRSILDLLRLVRRTAPQTVVRAVTHRRHARAARGHRHQAEDLRRQSAAGPSPQPISPP